ncbi:hypothetical protein RJZ56_000655 [Blastomyces dermatitidis]
MAELRKLFSHRFRYGSGKILNESGWVSEEQRMLIMKHADRRTFIDHYHPRTVGTEMIRTICGLDPDKEMMRSVARLDRWRDQRRSRHLTTEDKKRMKDHPELVTARQKLETITAEYHQTRNPDFPARIRRQEREVRNTQRRLLRAGLCGNRCDKSLMKSSLSSTSRHSFWGPWRMKVRSHYHQRTTCISLCLGSYRSFSHIPYLILWKQSGNATMKLLIMWSSIVTHRKRALSADA